MPNSATDDAEYDLAVIGAGVAGLTGAVTAAELGLSVALLDSSAQPGGQFYRHPAPALGATRPQALHHDWSTFTALRRRLADSGVTLLAGHHVWTVVRAPTSGLWDVHAVTGADGDGECPVRVRARAVLLATGAYERHLPFPGWTLPGVVGAGGAQAMLKSGLVLPGAGTSSARAGVAAPPAGAKPAAGPRVVVAGSGPLLLAVAASLAKAGARVPAVVEASSYLGYARHPRTLAANAHKAAEAARHGAALLRHGVRLRTRSAVTQVHGSDRVAAVTVSRLDRDWRPVRGSGRRIACDALAVGFGLVPQLELATGLGCATRRAQDGSHVLVLDAQQQTSVPGIWAAGETGGIGGAQLAHAEGEMAGIAIAARLAGHRAPAGSGRVRALRRRRDRMRAFASVMAAVHAPGAGWSRWLDDTTDVCRCEEVSAGRIREAVADLGARDARTVKLLTRAGMGWCQGRICGAAVACLAAEGREERPPVPAERRPLAVPVRLDVLAARTGTTAPDPGDPQENAAENH
ncbi:FAD/NAD(P)-binding oxidoreductase [Streptomyces sp. NRRL F-4489]|uniref:NAD(P)/FAD-dependent oxidoreductase n=1 Tax=Streptomyces sp. NRRL F-4489 TaxID=1609095 RepID=UPI000749AC99|nr:NAD(P)/FAD-dependent oxidoreductase [Streptomyces sp. NRRL F-4489]KUL55526.1 FAD/NAD(P)-binding oxidoreductase [Streptomyces sp. NRRL F-4489]